MTPTTTPARSSASDDTTSQYCTFMVDGASFAVGVREVQEVIRYQHMTRVPLAPAVVSGLINLRGQIVTAIDLRRRLGLPDRPADQLPMNVVVQREDGPVSLLVDEIDDVVEIDASAIEAPPQTLRGSSRALVAGVHQMADRLLLILATDRAVDVADC